MASRTFDVKFFLCHLAYLWDIDLCPQGKRRSKDAVVKVSTRTHVSDFIISIRQIMHRIRSLCRELYPHRQDHSGYPGCDIYPPAFGRGIELIHIGIDPRFRFVWWLHRDWGQRLWGTCEKRSLYLHGGPEWWSVKQHLQQTSYHREIKGDWCPNTKWQLGSEPESGLQCCSGPDNYGNHPTHGTWWLPPCGPTSERGWGDKPCHLREVRWRSPKGTFCQRQRLGKACPKWSCVVSESKSPSARAWCVAVHHLEPCRTRIRPRMKWPLQCYWRSEASQAQNVVPTAMVFSRGRCSDGKEWISSSGGTTQTSLMARQIQDCQHRSVWRLQQPWRIYSGVSDRHLGRRGRRSGEGQFSTHDVDRCGQIMAHQFTWRIYHFVGPAVCHVH
jgi:hypothetical protein